VLRSTEPATDYAWGWTPDSFGAGVGFTGWWGSSIDAGLTWGVFFGAPMRMKVTAEVVSPWTDLGFALAGVAGEPVLTGTGSLQAGSSGALTLTDAAPSALALMFVSVASTPTPFKGGTLVPLPPLLTLALPTDSLGSVLLPWASWPSGLSGLSLFFQYAIQDVAAVKGVALSNALGADVP
jgi:hypothetical protein